MDEKRAGSKRAIDDRVSEPHRSASLRAIDDAVDEYIRCHRPRAERELRHFQILRSDEEAVARAALAQLPSGNRHPHQRRIPRTALEQSRAVLVENLPRLRAASTFAELYDRVNTLIRPIPKIGELAVYDTSLRIGARIGLAPETDYDHAGTRDGARALGFATDRHTIEMSELPAAVQRLTAREAEDLLCIYKASLAESRNLRIEGPGGKRISSLEDWLRYAPPKKREAHWKPGRSAMESARAWLGEDGRPALPEELAELLDSRAPTAGFWPHLAIPELVTRLDDFDGEHRNHDLIAVGDAEGGLTLLAIEAKADESYGNHTVASYLAACARRADERSRKVEIARRMGDPIPRPSNARARVEQLCAAVFGPAPDGQEVAERALPVRYQLITAVAGALIEARIRDCIQAVLVVHEFLSQPDPDKELAGTDDRKVARNRAAWHTLVDALVGAAPQDPGGLTTPVQVPGGGRVPSDVPLMLGKATRQLN
jgi:hypothetical protein